MIRFLLASVGVAWSALVWPCSPPPWIKSAPLDDPAAYARNLMEKYDTIVRARVISAGLEPSSAPAINLVGFADIEVLERLKGRRESRRIFTEVRMATCANPEFIPDEERLFVLYLKSERLFEVHAWRHGYTDGALLPHLRALSSQPNLSQQRTGQTRPAAELPR
jgi:hypothetical protein